MAKIVGRDEGKRGSGGRERRGSKKGVKGSQKGNGRKKGKFAKKVGFLKCKSSFVFEQGKFAQSDSR